MKIAMMTNNYKPVVGGVPISIERLSDGLRRLGHETTVFAPEYPGYGDGGPEESGVMRYRSLERFGKRLGGIHVPNSFDIRIERRFQEGGYDLIHVHHPMLIGYTALYLAKKYRCPITFTYHTRYEQYLHFLKPYAALQKRYEQQSEGMMKKARGALLSLAGEKAVPAHMRAFSNQCDLVFAPTPTLRHYLREIGVRSEIDVVPTGLADESFEADEKTSGELRARYLGNARYLFCTVSRLSAEKNISFLLRGMRAFKERAGDCFRFLIIGDGAQRGELEAQAARLGLADQTLFAGNIDNHEIGRHLRACDAFLFASKSETQGIVLLEAMAAGNPVVAVRAPGTADVVRDGVCGLMTDENEEEWAGALLRVAGDPALLERMRAGARKEAENYREERIARMALRGYRRACFGGREEKRRDEQKRAYSAV